MMKIASVRYCFYHRKKFYTELHKLKERFPDWTFSSYKSRERKKKGHRKACHPFRAQKQQRCTKQRCDGVKTNDPMMPCEILPNETIVNKQTVKGRREFFIIIVEFEKA